MFSHSHMVGAGGVDYGWVGIMPISVKKSKNLVSQLLQMSLTKYGWRSKFSHQMQQAHPGYYQVYLHSHRVNVQLTATEHVGIHKYNWDYPDQDQKIIILAASYSLSPDKCIDASVTISSNQTISGFIYASGAISKRFGGVKTYFYANITTPFISFGTYDETGIHPLGITASGCKSGAYVIFASEKQPIEMKVGISYVGLVQA